jgi:hypothetical protein
VLRRVVQHGDGGRVAIGILAIRKSDSHAGGRVALHAQIDHGDSAERMAPASALSSQHDHLHVEITEIPGGLILN